MTLEKQQDETLLVEWVTLLKVLYRDLFDFFNAMKDQKLNLPTTLRLFDESGARAKLAKLQELQIKVDTTRTREAQEDELRQHIR